MYLGGWLVGSVVVCDCDQNTGIDLPQIPGDWPRKFPRPMEREPKHCATPQSTARRFPGGKRILGNPPPSCGQLGSSLFPPIRKKDPRQNFPNPPKAPASWNHPSLPRPARPQGTTETPQGLSLVTSTKNGLQKKLSPGCIYSESDRKNPFSLLHALTGIHD